VTDRHDDKCRDPGDGPEHNGDHGYEAPIRTSLAGSGGWIRVPQSLSPYSGTYVG